ncbi:MAG: FAD-binding protein [Hyphomicrobiaceae bacterium]
MQEQVTTCWGRIERVKHAVASPRFLDEAESTVRSHGSGTILPVGKRRSYGDTVLNSGGALLDTTKLDRIICFDRQSGILAAEAGLTIDEALHIVVPHGWFFNTTPGTRFVTLGGAVANDVHGKNHHHSGSFGCGVRRICLVRSDGTTHVLDARDDSELFRATIGGLGLTGFISWVEVQLVRIPSARLRVERVSFGNLSDFFILAGESGETHEHTVAWIDCANGGRALGRGIFQRGNWNPSNDHMPHPRGTKAAVPLEAPTWLLSRSTVRAFNSLYWRKQQSGPAVSDVHYGSFFYPLDAIRDWNLLYGRSGFYQYQCVVPPQSAEPAVRELVSQIVKSGAGSFLAVLKTFGSIPSIGYLSFPMEGATLALDFANRGQRTLDLLSRLDDVVREARGRLYPAKDGRMPARVFREGYGPRLAAFESQLDPAVRSNFWARVTGE